MILKTIDNLETFCGKAEPILGVFASEKWLSVYGKELTIIGIYKDELQLIGGFYFLKTRKYGFTFLKLPPYTPHCGLFFVSDSKNVSSINNFSKEIMSEVCNFFISQKSALTVLAFPSAIIDFQPFIWSKFKVIPNYTYRVNLEQPIEVIRANFDPKNRNVINKAIKEEVLVTENSLGKEELFNFFMNSLNSTNANIYEAELNGIFMKFSDYNNSFSVVARKDSQILGVVFCVFDKNTCYYLLGGVDKKSGVQGVNNLLVQKSIEKAKDLGCKTFDFEGSMLKGVEKFFRSFGPELVPYFTVNKASLPLEILLKFKKRELF
ncbi:MAG: family N-acetyltransferase [Bacteroidetes bacterium]|jgi:lipid II:glycine glycyltransferase (peptidoglycan interpeptide bridge formation enzyme)|nr:family N-acetyltransferase [Bacteroidota bacterium]MDF2452462.1 family N-acetyltransferase [Bacteroidota bacterium]